MASPGRVAGRVSPPNRVRQLAAYSKRVAVMSSVIDDLGSALVPGSDDVSRRDKASTRREQGSAVCGIVDMGARCGRRPAVLDATPAKNTHLLTRGQRLAWINELLDGDPESLRYRVAGPLLLLYAQPLVKIVALPTAAVVIDTDQTLISLGAEPLPVPEPFADMLREHLRNRPNLRTAGGTSANPWLFPGRRAGKDLEHHTMMLELRTLGINLLGARNSALQSLVAEIPPPVVAHLLGYSLNCTQRHARLAPYDVALRDFGLLVADLGAAGSRI